MEIGTQKEKINKEEQAQKQEIRRETEVDKKWRNRDMLKRGTK